MLLKGHHFHQAANLNGSLFNSRLSFYPALTAVIAAFSRFFGEKQNQHKNVQNFSTGKDHSRLKKCGAFGVSAVAAFALLGGGALTESSLGKCGADAGADTLSAPAAGLSDFSPE